MIPAAWLLSWISLAASAGAPEAPVVLPSSKLLAAPIPGSPGPLNSFPAAIAVSPDGRFAVTLNDGYGTPESGGRQSLTVLDLAKDAVADFPDRRLGKQAKQSFFLGLAFSSDGKRLYASVGSTSDPGGERPGDTGGGVAVYDFNEGRVTPAGFLKIPPQPLAAGKIAARLSDGLPDGRQVPFPAGLAVVAGPTGDRLLVADDLSDDAVLLDAGTGELLRRFDLSVHKVVPGSYPCMAAASRDGRRGWVSLWNASRVAELDLEKGTVERLIELNPPGSPTASGSHPTALALSPDGERLFVTLANADRVAVIDAKKGALVSTIPAGLPGQDRLGAFPNALALSGDGSRLYVADAGVDAVGVIDPARGRVLGFAPTQWYPSAVAVAGGDLLVASAKGAGAGRNDRKGTTQFTYVFELLRGSLARWDRAETEKRLPELTGEAVEANWLKRESDPLPFPGGRSPIRHVIYIIKENRTYDQVLGDLPEGDGDPALVMYGEDVTPNQHAIARQFGILDRFYASGDVSGDGHNWSTAALASDYTEKTIQINYRGDERTYDYEGQVANRFPDDDDMPDVAEGGTGYIWTAVAKAGLSYRHYGEFIATRWCSDAAPAPSSPKNGTPSPEGERCAKAAAPSGPWPWKIPVLAENVATKPELRGHFDPRFPDFNLAYPDQLRADEFLREFDAFVSNRNSGRGATLPSYITLRLPNDHTSAKTPGRATPAAAVADNDLAVGRVVDAVSHSPYWDDTAILIVEDDAQNGPDHVDAHRTTAYVVSRFSPRNGGKAVVDHRFYTTVAMLRTIEELLGLPPMNVNDAHSAWPAPLFSGPGDQPAFRADYRNRDNGLIYRMNPDAGPDAEESKMLDFSKQDRADAGTLNAILWRDRKGNAPPP